jgi:hypothetical protein
MALSRGPKIVTSGLVLALDAADKNSYPGTGTTWTDLSGNANVGTLINSPTFSNSNGGCIVFDGIDDYVTIPYSSTWVTTSATYEIWIKKASAGVSGEFLSRGISDGSDQPRFYIYANNDVYFDWSNNGTDIYVQGPTPTFNSTGWNQIVGVAVPGVQLKVYINATLMSVTASGAGGITSNPLYITSQPLIIGGVTWIPRYFNGNISIVKLYNRELSATEVLQNYNAQKTRFGL